MAKLLSDAGEMQINIREIQCEGDSLIMVGQIGVWNSRVVFPIEEIWGLLPGAPKLRILGILVRGGWKALRKRRVSSEEHNA